MATMSFTGDAKEWYSFFRVENPNPPWPVLVDEIFERFKVRGSTNPVVQFKKVQQGTTVDEYIKEFQRAKSRLLAETGIQNEYFFVWSFICGLREELQNSINLFKPKTLNEAFNLALEMEIVLGSSDKKPSFLRSSTIPNYKPQAVQHYRPGQIPDGGLRRNVEAPVINKPTPKTQNNLTLDQKRALGLCFRCGDK